MTNLDSIFNPITSWEIDEETVETVSDSILGGSKITADGDCSHEIKKRFVELCVEPAGLCGRCTGVAVPLRVVPSPTGLPSKRGPGSFQGVSVF